MIVHFAVFGLAYGAVLPMRAVVMADWYPCERYGALMGAQAAPLAAGRAVFPAVAGVLADVGGHVTSMAVLGVALTVGVVFVAVAAKANGAVRGSSDNERRGED